MRVAEMIEAGTVMGAAHFAGGADVSVSQ